MSPTPQPLGMTRDEIIAEVEHLWGTDHPVNIARRLGYSRPEPLIRTLYRADRPDLAVKFGRRD
jgi:hypothetical protein